MQSPLPRSVIANTAKQGSVYLVNQQHFENNSKPHFFVLLNKNPQHDQNKWHLIHATSNIWAATSARKAQGWPKSTIVMANKSDCDFLSKRSVFDCNYPYSTPINDFLTLCDESPNFRYKNEVSKTLLNKLLKGIQDSLIVSPHVKNQLL